MPPTTDPIALVDALSVEEIIAKINDLDRQVKALRVLLRAARARERPEPEPAKAPPAKGARHG